MAAEMIDTKQSWFQRLVPGAKRRKLRESITGYVMIFPATFLVFLFGIFPVGFALYVSVNKWRLKRTDFLGLDNYTNAIGSLAYVGLFALAVGGLLLAYSLIKRIQENAEEHQDKPWRFALPGIVMAAAVASFIRWSVLLLPQVLDIADKIVGLEKTPELFRRLLGEAFRTETVLPAFYLTVALLAAAIAIEEVFRRSWRSPRNLTYQSQFALVWLSAAVGGFLFWFTYSEASRAYLEAIVEGTDTDIWAQIITISSGLLLFMAAWFVWKSAKRVESNRAFVLRLLGAVLLLGGGWLLIAELPIVIAAGDDDVWSGLVITVFYSFGTVPFQLGISLFLAVLLFQKLRGSELMRMLFFLPYVTPAVASAAIFKQLFSARHQSLINQLLIFLGLDPQRWLQEPNGIFSLMAQGMGFEIPAWMAGPSLALVVIMIYSIWVYVGYDTVIYLAGLGNISTELIEAAEIDGAGRWQVFRQIIFPLLSPTTYFLSLISIIGTFKAFNHIWIMRHELSLGSVNTFSITIFLEFYEKVRYGYASALAFVLFAIILGLTVLNNRIQGSKVFYG
ncbi:MAG: sugar ABC transporter permease [Anaerolineales bacterium]|nr:sugar ABC transporter permease [Anaerolineales bacterium]